MNWINPIDPVKSAQSNSKKWIGSDKWIDMDFKNEKSIKRIKNQIPDKTELNPKH
jgi:hypothetical protein